MKPLSIEKLPSGLFCVLLPACNEEVLRFVLDERVPYVWLLNCRVQSLGDGVQAELKRQFPKAPNGVIVRCWTEFDFGLFTADFLADLQTDDDDSDRWDFNEWPQVYRLWERIELIQAYRPLPRNFCPDGEWARSRVRLFRTLNIHMQFSLPHTEECAMVEALDEEVLQGVIHRVQPYFEKRKARRFTAVPDNALNGGSATSDSNSGVSESPPSLS